MIDSLKLESPPILDELARQIEDLLTTRTAIDNRSGELLYLFNSGSLEGSHDSRIMVRVERERLVRLPSLEVRTLKEGKGNKARYRKRSCAPFLVIEGSVHKAMLGHNVYGGPESFQPAARWFLDHIASDLGVALPEASSWFVRRVDVAEIYALTYNGIADYMWGLTNARFPARKPMRYGEESIAFAGRTTTVNIYHKGPEFSKHDHKRLSKRMIAEEVDLLQSRANGIMRAEVQIKAPKLDHDFGHKPTVVQVTDDYLNTVHDREMARLMREGESNMRTVRKQRDVLQRLHDVHSKRLAGVLFGTWFQLSTLGEKVTRQHMERPTFYRHRKQLEESGVSWHGSDVLVLENVASFPQDFAPIRTDPRRVAGEDSEVTRKLARYRAA